MANKTERIQIRISESDLRRIDSKAAKVKMTRTNYMVAASLNKPVTYIDGGQEIVKQLMKLGTNINQITALAHIGKVKVVYMDEYAKEVRAIWQLLSSLTAQAKHISECET